MWIVGLLSVSFFLHVLAVDRRLHERLCCHAAPFIDNNGIHGWFIAWGHEYFFLSITRIVFFTRIVTGFSSLSRIIELSNFVFTRNIADGHGFSFSFLVPNYRIFEFCLHTEYHGQSRISFLSRIFEFYLFVPRLVLCPETCPWTHWPQGGNYRIIEFLSSVTFRDTPCDYKKIRKFANSWQRKIIPQFSVWLKRNNSLIRKFVTKIIQRFSVWL